MSGFEPEPAFVVAGLVADSEKARESGDDQAAAGYLDKAVDALIAAGGYDRALDLCLKFRLFARAAQIAESQGRFQQAAEFCRQAGEFVRAAEMRQRTGEPTLAAELYEQGGQWEEAAGIYEEQGDFTRASRLYERLGHRRRAADLLRRVVMQNGIARVSGAELSEICRRAGVLYHELGEEALAIEVLQRGNQTAFAGRLLAEAGEAEEAIQVLVEAGDYLAAAEVARSSHDERRAQVLLAERAENEGRLAEAAQHQEQAGEHIVAARLYEFAGELFRAAATYEAAGQYEVAARIWTRVGDTVAAQRCFTAESSGEGRSPSTDAIREHLEAGRPVAAAEAARRLARAGAREHYEEALAIVEGVGRDHPDYVSAQALLAELLEESGHPSRALSVLQRLFLGRRPMPEDAPAMYLYGRLLEAEGFLAGARNAFAAVAAFDPKFRDVKARLHLLREVDRRGSTTPRGVPVLPVVVGAPDATMSRDGAPAQAEPRATSSPSGSFTMDLFDRELAALSSDLRLEELSGQLASTSPSHGLPPVASSDDAARPGGARSRNEPGGSGGAALPMGAGPTGAGDDDPTVGHVPSPRAATDAAVVEGTRRNGSMSVPLVDRSDRRSRPPGPRARPDSLVGVVLRGRFRIERKIGRGAQAQVYVARDQVLDREVAIKVLSETVAHEDAALDRFLREARLAARVHHSGCIAIFDFGQEHGRTFMAMEYFRGRTLRDLIKRGPLEPYLALRITRDVASALGAVHEAGIVHRDVKPTNVMVDRRGQVRLTDFGVARTLEDTSSSGMMVGTMKYMAPEQARGKEVDRRADIFSLGVVLYEMLNGTPPFGGSLDALIARVTKAPPPLPVGLEVSDAVRALVSRCMAKRPEQRFAGVPSLMEALNEEISRLKEERKRRQSSVAAQTQGATSD